jgi:thiamine pyrophosphokinase
VHTTKPKNRLGKAFDYLYERKIAAVNVVWATGKRTDHTITNLYCSLSRKIRIVILDDHSKVFLLSKIRKMVYSKHPISLIPIGHVTGIHSENLFYALQDESLTIGYRTGSSNHVIKDGVVIIEHKEGDLLMMECSD